MTRFVIKPAYVYAVLTVFLWSTVATAFKIALHHVNYIQLLLIANTTSLAVYALMLGWQKQSFRPFLNTKSLGLSALQGLLSPFAYYLLVFKAYSILPAQIAQPVNFIWPLVLMVLSAPLLNQRLHLSGIIALLISFSGVLILSSQGHLAHFRIKEPVGILLAIFSAFIWALFWIINLKDNRSDIVKLFLSSGWSLLYIVLLALLTGNLGIPEIKGVLAAIYVGLFEMGITWVLWLKALQGSESTGSISNLVYLTPFLSLILINTVLGEKLYFTSLIGLFLIITGIGIQQMKKQPG
jgi:drug/metabolite transporter (DMT)-like permease